MSSTTVRPKGGRRQDGGYQSFQNSNQNRTSKNKWNNNVQHPVNNAPRSQTIPQTTQPSANHHNNSNNTTSSGTNSLKPIELIHDEVSANHVNHMHDRMLFLLSNFVGINVVVTVRSGAKYQGLFHAAHTEGELGVILKLARKVVTKQEEKNLPNCVIPVFILPHKEVMEIHACGVDFSASLEKPLNEREGFRTDTDISGRTEIRERELHKWASEESGETMKGLEDDINPDSANASWDQFAANEKLFGIKTDFNEEFYTTKLDRTGADFKERERQAIAIANEITRTSTTNIHMLEERGHLVEDNQMDEEERYGAVVRNRDPSKYMPPPLRKLQEQQQLQQHGSAPAIKKPEAVKEPIKDAKTKPTEEPKTIKPIPPPSAAPVPPSPSLPKDNNSSLLPSPLASFRVESDVSPINPHNPKKPDTDADGKPIEAVIMKTFRKFANHEKERLQQRKQAIFKKEMDGRVAELLKWGQSFKLNSPLPKDLIPILTKDETKRQQLVAKSEAAMSEKENDKEKEKLKEKEKEKQELEKGKEKDDDKPKEKTTPIPNTDVKTEFLKPIIKIEEEKSPQSNVESKSVPENVTAEKPTSAADKAPPQHPPSKTPVTTPANTQFKLNAKASEWKPNPNAASFTPTPNTNGDKRSPSSSPFFGNRQLKKNSASLKDGFSPFKKGKSPDPNSIPPTWPFGQKPFRHHFTVTTNYEEDIYTQASVNQGFGFTAYPVAPYRFTTGTQFVGVPPMPIQQTTPMQYMPGFVPGMPFTTAPMPPNGAPPTIYSPQIPPVIPQHFGSQGFPSPGRTPMVPTGMHPQMYPPYQNPHGLPPMMRYPHEIVPHVPPAGVMMSQRPMVMEQHYETAPMEVMPVSDQTTTQ